MSYDQNYVRLKGRLGHDAEVKYNPQGVAVAKFTVATSEQWKDKQTGEKKERTEWHKVTAFSYAAEDCAGLLKGERVIIEGAIRTNEWTDRDGNKRTDKEILATVVDAIEFRGKRKEKTDAPAQGGGTAIPKGEGAALPKADGAAPAGGDPDDDLPF